MGQQPAMADLLVIDPWHASLIRYNQVNYLTCLILIFARILFL